MSKDGTKTLLSLCGDLFFEDADSTLTITDLEFSSLNTNTPSDITITNTSRYERRGMLGQGGMGAVHEAYDKVLHRQVATKSLHKDVPLESSLWKRFYREAQITAQLAHPSIVPVYSIEFNDDKQPLLIMKRIQGVTLADYIAECQSYQGNIPLLYRLEQRLEILIKICDAMHYAHVKGVVHRDLKPENIMVGAFEDVYVMDWGVATPIQSHDPYEEEVLQEASLDIADLGIHTFHGQIIGTPRYMAPEQALADISRLGPSTDQFAIGMMLYELVTMKVGRPGHKVINILEMARNGNHHWNLKSVDPRLRSIIEKSTALENENRYESCRQMALDLRQFMRDQSVSALPEYRLMRVWRRMRQHPIQLALGLSVFFAIGALITIFSLWSALSTVAKSAQHERITGHLLNQISVQKQSLDRRFADVQRRVQRLAVRLESLHTLSSELLVEESCLNYEMLKDHPSSKVHSRYGNSYISVEQAVCLVPETVDPTTAGEGLWLSSALTPYLKQEFWGTDGMPSDFWEEQSVHSIQWGYAGFVDGTLLNYPGVHHFGEGYDPRQRPWYISGIERVNPGCGDPYPDASGSGYLLPCNQRVLGSDGKLLGVVGLDFLLDSVLQDLEKNQPKDVEQIFLLEQSGDVLFSTLDKGLEVESLKVSHANRSKRKVRFDHPNVVAAVQNKQRQGMINTGRTIYVFAQLEFVPWTLVYAFDGKMWSKFDLELFP